MRTNSKKISPLLMVGTYFKASISRQLAFCVAISSDLEERRRKMENTLELSLEQAGCTASSILSRKNATLWRNAVKQTLPMTGCFCVLFLIKENFELMILFCARFFLYSKAFSSTWCSLADTPSAMVSRVKASCCFLSTVKRLLR